MRIRVRNSLHYVLSPPVTMLLNFRARSSGFQTVINESLEITPYVQTELIVTQPEQNRFDRIQIFDGENLTINYSVEVETNLQVLDFENLSKALPATLDQAIMPFLFPSRYCQSDLLARLAWQKFGHIAAPYSQVLEITRWIHDNVEYLPGETTSSTSAYDTVTQCAGVCRDFAHLGIALCRALTIPARYFTGYAHRLEPPDFHACFEAFIGGHWVLFDPTELSSPDGLVCIGTGRDAADVSVCTAYGTLYPGNYEIRCEILDQNLTSQNTELQGAMSVTLN